MAPAIIMMYPCPISQQENKGSEREGGSSMESQPP